MTITVETVELAAANGRQFLGHLARPASGRSPGLLVLPEMFGVNEPMRELADTYARKGFCVLVPNVFWRCDVTGALAYEGEEREVAWERLRNFDFETVGTDLKTAVDWLRASPHTNGKVGAIGFCAGGRLAVISAIRAKVDVAISLYALGLPHHLAEAGSVECPVQLHYGLEDRHVPRSEIEAVQAATAPYPSIQVFVYPGAGHSFFNPVRPTYDAAAAALAGQRIDEALSQLA